MIHTYTYTYQSALAASEIPHWRIEDIIGGDKRLDFDKPFMPGSLARVGQLTFLNDEEKRTLNQIRGHAYLVSLAWWKGSSCVRVECASTLQGDDYVRITAICHRKLNTFNSSNFRQEFRRLGTECAD